MIKEIRKCLVETFGEYINIDINISNDGYVRNNCHTEMYTDGHCLYTHKSTKFIDFNIIIFINRDRERKITEVIVYLKGDESTEDVFKKSKDKILEFLSYSEFII